VGIIPGKGEGEERKKGQREVYLDFQNKEENNVYQLIREEKQTPPLVCVGRRSRKTTKIEDKENVFTHYFRGIICHSWPPTEKKGAWTNFQMAPNTKRKKVAGHLLHPKKRGGLGRSREGGNRGLKRKKKMQRSYALKKKKGTCRGHGPQEGGGRKKQPPSPRG